MSEPEKKVDEGHNSLGFNRSYSVGNRDGQADCRTIWLGSAVTAPQYSGSRSGPRPRNRRSRFV